MDYEELKDVPRFETFKKIEQVKKGWSTNKKFYIENERGQKLLLRLADIKEYDKRKLEFSMMEKVYALGVPMQKPNELGICNSGKSVYQLLTWIEGEDLESALLKLTEKEQYMLGVKAGKILKSMQLAAIDFSSEDWEKTCREKHQRYIQSYKNLNMSIKGGDTLIKYIEENQHLLKDCQTVFSHDDFCLGNLILSSNNEVYVIDFEKFRNTEVCHTMNGLMFSAKLSPYFATGQVKGYFECVPTNKFWQTFALHNAALAIQFLSWKTSLGKSREEAEQQIKDILYWYNDMQNYIPSWYIEKYK